MPSAASASISALLPRTSERPKPTGFTPVPVPTMPALPNAPEVAGANPANVQQEDWIRQQLTPGNAAWIGNKYKAQLTQARTELQGQLAAFGGYDWNQDQSEFGSALGVGTPTERRGTGESLGEAYRTETLRQIAAANARGMASSRMADEAVGLAWSRLNSQKRDFFTRYATTVSSSLGQMQSEQSSLTTNLLDLYGSDAQYALENPILEGGEESITPVTTTPGAPAVPTTPKMPGKNKAILWKGKYAPTAGSIRKVAARHDLKPGQVARKKRGGGQGFVIARKK